MIVVCVLFHKVLKQTIVGTMRNVDLKTSMVFGLILINYVEHLQEKKNNYV
ncbi:hypothetical protein vBEcoMphAPEC6_gp140c [Escherichia phage vB_EcoM_phAPEC6]|nr:hypothetical protein vBEcoMphAPEC6_gp140c [Escherichia phage vB_EcoM_phAPEC6]